MSAERPTTDPLTDGDASGRVTRRHALALGAGAAGAVLIAGCGTSTTRPARSAVAAADVVLRPRPDTVEIGRRTVRTWTYDGGLPGRAVRLRQGVPVRIRVDNGLPAPTSIHWHGIRLENRADGVPGMTQEAIAPGASFLYEFTPPDAGTYFLHPHVGVQLDRGLYAPLIVEPRSEPLVYDREAVLMLDDWLDGVDGTPDAMLERLRRQEMGAMARSGGGAKTRVGAPHTTADGGTAGSDSLAAMVNGVVRAGDDAGDIRYPLYLVNGRPPEDPARVTVRRGDRLRLRLVNAGSDTIFSVWWVEGHRLTVTHADGQPVDHVSTDGLVIGMGERYDVLLDADRPGVHRIVAMPLGKPGRAVALLRYRDAPRSSAPRSDAPVRMPRRLLSYEDLVSPDADPSPRNARVVRLPLGAAKTGYGWTIGGQAFPKADVVALRRGAPVRLVIANETMMPHPMHLHGHSFRPLRADGRGPLKDTILIPARRTATIALVPDNPGTWAFHCHNIYHAEAGMLRAAEVDRS